jgi:peptidoglycan-associated lipoprotein
MRNVTVLLAVVTLLLLLPSCGKKPLRVEDQGTETVQGPGVTVEGTDTGIKEEDIETVDEGVKIGKETGFEERSISEMTLDEINAAEFLRNIYFDFDKSELRDDAVAQLETNATWLLENTSVRVIIEGHCDERGTEEYNLALGERRSKAARDYLVRRGVSADRLMTVSYGESKPADPGHNEAAWALNRRAQFRVYAR